jgi:aminopeptidase N
MSWYPVNNHPLDKASYTFRISVARPYVVAANGLLEAEIEQGQMVTYVWQMDDPMASYLATVNIGRYVRVEESGPDGLLIRNYFPVEASERLKNAFSRTAEMIDYFSDLLGPYPFDVYGVIVVGDDLGFALETQTLSIFGATSARESTVAHELMHQWLGNSVSPATWQDIWLNEGFAEYFTMLWLEHKQGREALEAEMASLYRRLESLHVGPPAAISVEEMFSPAVYFRGAWTLHALRLEVGDEVFFDILRTYYQRFAHSNASTAGFIAVANEVSGRDLSEFLERWLYEEALPPVPDN